MSSCFTGGSTRAYGFENTIIGKSPSSSVRSPASPSSSSTIFSDASTTTTASLTITTKKQRAPRKRPNQVYSEAAALLSTVYPNVFSAHNLKKEPQRSKSQRFVDEPPELVEEPLSFISADTQLLIFQPPPGIAGHEPGVRPGIQLPCGDEKINSSVENRSSSSEDFSDSKVSVLLHPPATCDSGEFAGDGSRSGGEMQSGRDEFSDSDLPLSPAGSIKETKQYVSENGAQLGSGNQSEMDETEHTVDGKPVSGDNTENFSSYEKTKSGSVNQFRSDHFSEAEYVTSGTPVLGQEAGSPEDGKEFEDELEAGSLLDVEVDKGIDSILGRKEADRNYEQNQSQHNCDYSSVTNSGYENNLADHWALQRARDRVPAVEVMEFMPRLRLVDKIMAQEEQSSMAFCSLEWVKKEDNSQSALSLKLNYDKVVTEWSGRGSPYAPADVNQPADGCLPSSSPDAFARLMQYDVFPDIGMWKQAEENGGLRVASVLRYKEKRRRSLFNKKIRYEVRKVNADNRPRMKGRFVRRP